jgi:hypothetical protein
MAEITEGLAEGGSDSDATPISLEFLHWPDEGGGVPVHEMDQLLEAGEPAVEPLRAFIRDGGEPDRYAPYWAAVLLGELGDAAAVPELAAMILRAEPDHLLHPLAAAGALARLGDAAIPTLREIVETAPPHQRLWAYHALGQLRADAAFRLLLERLEADPEMLDVVAQAIADQGGEHAREPLARALERAEPWQRPEIEDSIALAHGIGDDGDAERDWRLRYRPDPGVARFPLNWATVAAITRSDGAQLRRKLSGPARTADEVVQAARTEQRDPCDCCGVPEWAATGVSVCPATAVDVPERQALMVEEMAERIQSEDLWDVLDEVDYLVGEASAKARRRGAGRRQRERAEHQLIGLRVLRAGVVWLLDEGYRNAARGADRLRREVLDAEERWGRETRSAPAPTVAAEPRPGRNEPCTCGSGKKFKRCCGPPP